MSINNSKDMRVAVILFNLGGPDSSKAIKPFLFNLFNDKNIINIPNPFRFLLAKLISNLRHKTATQNYNLIGGKSPLLENTKKQRDELAKILDTEKYLVEVCMTFWHPFPTEVLSKLEKFQPDKIILLPLYPQFSVTTTNAFLQKWNKAVQMSNLSFKQDLICCYHSNKEFINASSLIFKDAYKKAQEDGVPYVIFVAHGLPEKIVKSGDPYQSQVEKTVKAIINKAKIKDLTYILAFQSRVGPVPWIKPYADDVIIKAAQDKRNILIVPISFVSEHVETLCELDIECKELALENGAKAYHRANTVQTHPDFIKGLANLVMRSDNSVEVCNSNYSKCFQRNGKS